MPQESTAPRTNNIQTIERFPSTLVMRHPILAIRRRAVPYYGQKHAPVCSRGIGPLHDPCAMADLHYCSNRLCLRHLRVAHASAHFAARARTARRVDVRESTVRAVARPDVLRASGQRRNFRTAWGIPHRPPGAAARADLEHSDLCGFGGYGRLRDIAADVAVPADD